MTRHWLKKYRFGNCRVAILSAREGGSRAGLEEEWEDPVLNLDHLDVNGDDLILGEGSLV